MEPCQEQPQRNSRETKGVEEEVASNSNECSSPPSNNNSSSSSSSSPSHEFSFTISLNSHHHHHHHHSSFTNNNNNIFNNSTKNNNNIDLSPADEIFFHGHLLPLHLFSSHLPQSPRSSTNSMDSFTLPIRDLLEDDQNPIKENGNINISNNKEDINNNNKKNNNNRGNYKFKPSFSLLFGLKKGLKGSPKKEENKENHHHKKKRLNFDVIHAMKKYLRIVQQPLILFRRRSSRNSSRDKYRINGKSSYSYSSGYVTPNSSNNQDLFRGYWNSSAPASIRTSPTNSGLLVATTTTLPSRDSTMEELQAAIQAAIAHCKNSISKEEKKLPVPTQVSTDG